MVSYLKRVLRLRADLCCVRFFVADQTKVDIHEPLRTHSQHVNLAGDKNFSALSKLGCPISRLVARDGS